MAKALRSVHFERGSIKSVKADLVSGVVNITIAVPFAEALPAREDLAMFGIVETPVEVSITQLQSELDLKFGNASKPGQILEEVAKEINESNAIPGAHAEVRRANS